MTTHPTDIMKKQLKITSILGALAALPASAVVTLVGSDTGSNDSGDVTISFDATGADKLVVIVSGEHGFNNTNGRAESVQFNGTELSEAVYRLPVSAPDDILYSGIFYMDNPFQGTADVFLDATTRGSVTVMALSGTAPGIGATGIGTVGTRTLDLTVGTGSAVVASFAVGGNGNTGQTGSIDADAPLTEISAVNSNPNWDGHVTGLATDQTAGTNTYGFTGGNESGGFVVAAEILPIPEPSSTILLGLAGLGALGFRRRK